LQGDARTLFLGLARQFQLEAVFDSDYPPSAPLRFRLEEASWQEAARAMEAATGSFLVPLSEKRFLVVRDTPQKRQEWEPHITVAVPVPDLITAQEVQELRTAIQQVMQITRITFDPARRLLVLRDRASLAEPAQALLLQLLQRKPVVAIEVELVEVNRQVVTSYGASLATSYVLTSFGRPWRSPPLIPPGVTRFAVFGGGKTLLGLGIPDAAWLAQTSRSRGQTLFQAELRALDGQPAGLHVGARYPIVTAREILPDPSAPPTYPPTFTYEDLGLVVKATPRVHGAEEISLSMELSFKALSGVVVQDIPVITTRSYQSEVRLREGDWAVAAGLLSSNEARTITGLAGLTRIPILSQILSSHRKERNETEVLILLRPRLLSLPPGAMPADAVATGPEARPRIPL
jgi:Flp pilus assembly secretin CpaC